MKVKDFRCSQCGARDFVNSGKYKIRCSFCNSLYYIEDGTKETKGTVVTIKKGAKVTFGENANVTIKGKLEIEEGAEVEFNGKITLIEKSSQEKIKQAKLKLKKDE